MTGKMKRFLGVLLGAVLAGSGAVAVAVASPAQAAPATSAAAARIVKPVAKAGEYVKGKPTAATEAAAKARVASGQRAALAPPPDLCPGSTPVCFHYATGLRDVAGTTNTGATQVAAIVSQHKPALITGGTNQAYHTLWETAAIDPYNGVGRNIIEAGYTVDVAVNGDLDPHFFVYHWVDGATTCYNGCGWVDNPNENAVNAGTALAYTPSGSTPTAYYQYRIERVTGRPAWCTGATCTAAWAVGGNGWQIIQKNQGATDRIPGGFPDTVWTSAGSSFTAAPQYQSFWEVASKHVQTCTDMGSGGYGVGTLPHSAADLLAASNNYAGNDWDSVSIDPAGDSPSAFRVFDGAGYATPDTDRIRGGGPGFAANGVGAGSVGSC